MSFMKKTKYENIFEWVKKTEGTCFYCNENKPINLKFIGDKGICDDCAAVFEIGHIGTDRHAIGLLATGLNSHEEARKWLEDHGAKLVFKYESDGTHFYDCINDETAYNAFMKAVEKDGFYAVKNPEEMMCYNSVEISEDGGIHIIY